MPFQADLVYRDRDVILAELVAALQARIPNAALTEDTVFRILFEIFATSAEGLFQAVQLLHNDMFIQTAEAVSLTRYGEQYGLPIKNGTIATGSLILSGDGGTIVGVGTEVAAPQASDDALLFTTTETGTIPNPGIPGSPTAADAGTAGNLTGTYEWAVTFLTVMGETEIGAASSALVLSAHQANLTAIPIGGTGTTGRKIYRQLNGGAWKFVTTLANNTATTYTDNILEGSLGGAPPSESTAERITLAAAASEPGTQYNVLTGAITQITSSEPGLTTVQNTSAFTGGSDPENTEDFRGRLLDFVRNPKSGSKADLESWAETVDGVETATAFPNDNVGTPTNGHVTVRIVGPNGAVPSGGVQADVLALLQSKDMANITIHVATFTPLSVNSTVVITLQTGYVLADVAGSVTAAVSDYINSVPVNGTVYRAGIFAAVFGLSGVATVNVTVPASDVTTTATQKATAGTITVS